MKVGIFYYFSYPHMADEHLGIPGEELADQDQHASAQDRVSDPTKEIFSEEITFPKTSDVRHR